MDLIIERNVKLMQLNFLLLISSMIFKVDPLQTIIIIMEFMLIRATRNAFHYDKLYKCSFMTIILMGSIFLVLKIDFVIAILITFVAAIMLSEKNEDNVDLKKLLKRMFTEGFMYKKSKYDVMIVFRREYLNTPLMIEFERRLKKYAPKAYVFYEMRIIKNMKFREIEKQLGCDNRKITDQLNIAFEIFKTYFDIEG